MSIGTEKVFGLLGFARRAHKTASGEATVASYMKKGRVRLLLLAEDSSTHVTEKYRQWCDCIGVPTQRFGTKTALGLALGQSARSTVAILDDGFARAIQQALSDLSKGEQ